MVGLKDLKKLFSFQALDLLKQLLEPDPEKRPSAIICVSSPWLQKTPIFNHMTSLSTRVNSSAVLQSIPTKQIKSAMLEMVVSTKIRKMVDYVTVVAKWNQFSTSYIHLKTSKIPISWRTIGSMQRNEKESRRFVKTLNAIAKKTTGPRLKFERISIECY